MAMNINANNVRVGFTALMEILMGNFLVPWEPIRKMQGNRLANLAQLVTTAKTQQKLLENVLKAITVIKICHHVWYVQADSGKYLFVLNRQEHRHLDFLKIQKQSPRGVL